MLLLVILVCRDRGLNEVDKIGAIITKFLRHSLDGEGYGLGFPVPQSEA